MTGFLQDVGYSIRLLRRAPGFTVVALATLALGIGVSTAIFTIVDSVLLRPLPFPEPKRLVMIRPTSGSRLSTGYLHDWRLEGRTLSDMAGWHDVHVNVTGGGVPLDVLADRVTPNFFAVLGTPPQLGRTFRYAADLNDVEPEVILSQGFWQRRYGGDPTVIGQSITLDGESFTIVAVMPEGYTIRTTELSESHAELWIPFALRPGNSIGMGGNLHVVGRLAPTATPDQAQIELSLIARRIEQAYPSYSRDWGVEVIPLLDATVKDVRLVLLVLFGAVAVLLAIACANVANLVLSHVVRRRTELAIRLSLGATRGRLARQFLTESLVLTTLGGALGMLLALWGTQFLVSALPAGLDLPRTREIGVDLRILSFAFLVTMLNAILFGLVSSLRSSPQSVLREATRESSGGSSRSRLRNAIVIAEVALALVLLAGAGLLGRSFWGLSRVNPGFQAEHALTFRMTLPASKYESNERTRAFSQELLERIGRLPGVQAVGSVSYLPMSRFGAAQRFEIDGRPEARVEDQKFAWVSVTGGRYFNAMGIPLLHGHLPDDSDTERTEPAFLIDEEMARRFWPGTDPIGARLTWHTGTNEKLSGKIVGVVGSVRWGGMAVNPPLSAYFWFPQNPERQFAIVVRTLGDPVAMAGAVTTQVTDIDPDQPVADIRPMRDFVSADLAQPRLTWLLLGAFAAAALLLAAVGLYGVLAFNVTQRTREIGVRVALGAQHRDVLRLVMRQGLLLTGVGLTVGIATALALGRVVAGLLYGVAPTDPATLLAVVFFLAAVATLATYIPAQRATRVDPMVALKSE
jgi:putative ABC transport system permease protein